MSELSSSGLQFVKDLLIIFPDESPPPSNDIVYDNSEEHLECVEIRQSFAFKRWTSLSTPFLRWHADSIFFFTANAFAYYLPAYMRASITDYENSDIVTHNLLGALTRPSKEPIATFQMRVAIFNAGQKRLIKTYFEILINERSQDFPSRELELASVIYD
jgi:hypothetical protein